jgi:Flp pilus assembly protein TadB
MIEMVAFIVGVTIVTAIVATSFFWYGSGADRKTRARVRVRLHQIRRTRELSELRLAMRRDAQQLRRALDRDFDDLDEP